MFGSPARLVGRGMAQNAVNGLETPKNVRIPASGTCEEGEHRGCLAPEALCVYWSGDGVAAAGAHRAPGAFQRHFAPAPPLWILSGKPLASPKSTH